MSSNDVVIPANVLIKVPEKSFFKKYPYKIDFLASKEENEYRARAKKPGYGYSYDWSRNYPSRINVNREITNKLVTLLKEEEERREQEFDYRIRQEGTTVSIFFKDADIIELVFTDKLKSKVVALYKPLNANHLSKMEVEKRVRVRKSLFMNQYKFKVYLKPWAVKKFSEIQEWLAENFPEEGRTQVNSGLKVAFKNNNAKKAAWRYNSTLAIYLNDETDLMVAKLRLHEVISHVEEAVLISEL